MRRTKQATCFPVLHVHESRRLAEDAKFPSRRSGGKAGPHFSENELYRIPTDNQIFFWGGGGGRIRRRSTFGSLLELVQAAAGARRGGIRPRMPPVKTAFG
jgi:hypothetical protein